MRNSKNLSIRRVRGGNCATKRTAGILKIGIGDTEMIVEDSQTATDEDLLFAYRDKKDTVAFEQLFKRYNQPLFGFVYRRTKDAGMAEDVIQTTFAQVHGKCQQFRADGRVKSWLYAIAESRALDVLRLNRRHRNMDSLGQGQTTEPLDRHAPAPCDRLEHGERNDRIRQAVDRLPKPFREVVVLMYYQGLRYQEVADALGVPIGTIKSRLNAAHQKLKCSLAKLR